MSYLWNPSTTIRNSNRIPHFLETAQEIEGNYWTNSTMVEYQIRLIKNRYYHPQKNFHPLMRNNTLTYAEAEIIFNAQNYTDPPMRGRVSLSPLRKLGLVGIDQYNRVYLTDSGRYFIQYPLDITTCMLEWRFQNQANIRPFVATIRFIYELDQRLNSNNGITYSEFGHYVMTLSYFNDISPRVQYLLDVRSGASRPISINQLSNTFYNFNDYDDYLDNNIRYLNQSSIIDVSNNRVRLNYANINIIRSIINTFDGSATQNIFR